MSKKILEKFGRYILLDLVAQGGMAEIFRSCILQVDGTTPRLLAIKRILPTLGMSDGTVNMFKSETKVMLGMNHPNIVQLYDFGTEGAQPYIAMELLEGKSLRLLGRSLEKIGNPFPIEIALWIGEQAATGLHYVHSLRDRLTDKPFNIVHRDISPQNLFITYDGQLKVIDFGIVKTAINLEQTRTGIIKGKLHYMSPEQAQNKPLDGRSDLFSLGIVLWETLTGSRMFDPNTDDDFAMLRQIQKLSDKSIVKPSSIRPELPAEVDAIVLGALRNNRDQRYKDAHEFAGALRAVLRKHYSDFSPNSVANWMDKLYAEEQERNRKKLFLLIEEAQDKFSQDQSKPFEVKKEKIIAPTSPLKNVQLEFKKPLQSKADRLTPAITESHQAHRLSKSRPTRPSSQQSHSRFPLMALTLISLLGGYWAWQIHQTRHRSAVGKTDPLIQPSEALPPRSDVPRPWIKLALNPYGGELKIQLNGKAMNPLSPIFQTSVEEPITLSIEKPGYHPFTYHSNPLKTTAPTEDVTIKIPLVPIRKGYLSIRTTPSSDVYIRRMPPQGGDFEKNGETWIFKSPILKQPMPPGHYWVQLNNRTLALEKKLSLKIDEEKISKIEEILAPADLHAETLKPLEVPGLLGWYSSEGFSSALIERPLFFWNDYSSNTRTVNQSDSNARPVLTKSTAFFGKKTVSFNGRSQYFDLIGLTPLLRTAPGLTALVVARLNPTAENPILACENIFGKRVFTWEALAIHKMRFADMTYENQSQSLHSDGTPSIYSLLFSDDVLMLYENGIKIMDGAERFFSLTSAHLCHLGFRNEAPQGARFLNGEVAEALFYDHPLSVSDQTKLEAYLSEQYGIQAKR